jgi:hypothetical protein
VILIEFCDEAAQRAGGSCGRLRHLLESFGYALYRYNSEENDLIREEVRQQYPYDNLIGTKDRDSVLRRLGKL